MDGIDVTTEDIRNSYLHLLKLTKDKSIFNEEVEKQKLIEKKYLKSHNVCPKMVENYKLPNLNMEKLKLELGENFFNPELMKFISCIISSITAYSGEFSLMPNERIREYIKNLSQIGDISNRGNVIGDDFFVLKSPRSLEDPDELLHEAMVAFSALNELRNLIPNFSYVYGIVKCSPPYVTDEREVIAWCNTNKLPVSYVIYEKIEKSESFESFCKNKNCNLGIFMENYLQIVLSLREAQKQFKFSHNDLHSQNVLIKIYPEKKFEIPYNTENGKEYLLSNGTVATIIDYGSSHIELQNEKGEIFHFGNIIGDLTPYGIYRDKMNPIIDVYKLLCFCLLSMLENNDKCFNECKDILFYFNKSEDPITIINKQKNRNFFINYDSKTFNFNIDKYISFLREYLILRGYNDPLRSSYSKENKVLSCNGNCLSVEQEYIYLGFDEKILKIKNYIEYYDVYGSLAYKYNNETDIDEKEKLEENFKELNKHLLKNFWGFFEKEKEKLEILEKDFNIIIHKFPKSYNIIFSFFYLKTAKDSTNSYVKFLDSYQRSVLSLKVGRFLEKLLKFNKNCFVKFYDNLEEKLTFYKKTKNILEEVIKENILAIKDFEKLDEPYDWYQNVYLNLETYF